MIGYILESITRSYFYALFLSIFIVGYQESKASESSFTDDTVILKGDNYDVVSAQTAPWGGLLLLLKCHDGANWTCFKSSKSPNGSPAWGTIILGSAAIFFRFFGAVGNYAVIPNVESLNTAIKEYNQRLSPDDHLYLHVRFYLSSGIVDGKTYTYVQI